MSVILDRPYCTQKQVQRIMGDSNADHVDDILDAINRASRYIDQKSRWIFYRKQYTNAVVISNPGSPGNWTVWPAVNAVERGFIKSPYKPILKFALTTHVGNASPAILVEGVDYEVDYVNGRVKCLGYGWSRKPGAYTVTAQVGVDNGTEDLTATPVVPYDYSVPADTAHGMDGDIQQMAIQISAVFTNLWVKKVFVQGMMQPENRLQNKVDKDTLLELHRWAAMA
jgi:hypothetical protein